MKKDVVGMDRPRSEDWVGAYHELNGALAGFINCEFANLMERVTWCEQRDGAIQGRCHDLEERVAALELDAEQWQGLCKRVARLEERLFNNDLNALREGLLPWGDLD